MSGTDRRYGLIGNTAIKVPCRACSTSNITLSGEQTIDGVAVVTDDRVLVTGQTSSVDNGIYVADTGAWIRSTDMDGTYDIVTGTLIKVNSGTANSGFWYVTTTGTPVIGTDSVNFSMASTVLAVVSAFMQTMLDDANAAAAMTTLGLTANGQSLVTAANYAAMKALLDLEIGTDVQAYDATLAALAALTLTQGGLLTMTGADAPAILAKGAAGQVLRMNPGETAPEWGSSIIPFTPQASTSGTYIDFTVPAGAKRVVLMGKLMSTNGTSNLQAQLGDAGGIETSGYTGGLSYANATAVAFTAGFGIFDGPAAASLYNWKLELDLESAAAFSWTATSSCSDSAMSQMNRLSIGSKSLSAELTTIRITMANGTDAFDSGEIGGYYII